jgi:GH24 family phage-related lysozyme (muramidase)
MSILGSLLGTNSNRPEPSETMQNNAGGLMNRFNPFNLASGMFGKRKPGAADNYAGSSDGMKKGLKNKKDPRFVTKSVTSETPVQKGESVTNISAKLFALFKSSFDKENKEEKIKRTSEKSMETVRDKRNKELIAALTAEPKGLKKESKDLKKQEDRIKKDMPKQPAAQPPSAAAPKGPASAQPPAAAAPKGPASAQTPVAGAPKGPPAAGTPKPSASPATPKGSPAKPPAEIIPGAPAAGASTAAKVGVGVALAATGSIATATEFIAKEEGFPKKGKAYWDPPHQRNLVSIGYGHQIKDYEYKQGYIQIGSEKISLVGERGVDTVITKQQGEVLLSQDIGSYEDRARKPLGENAWNKLTDKQKAALTSYAYNAGSIGTLLKVGLREAILEGDTKKAAKIIEDYGVKTSKGKYMKVLEERRKREASLFASENIKQDIKQPASLPEGGKKLAEASSEGKDLKKQAAAAGGPVVINQNNNVVASADNSKTMTTPRSDGSRFVQGVTG